MPQNSNPYTLKTSANLGEVHVSYKDPKSAKRGEPIDRRHKHREEVGSQSSGFFSIGLRHREEKERDRDWKRAGWINVTGDMIAAERPRDTKVEGRNHGS